MRATFKTRPWLARKKRSRWVKCKYHVKRLRKPQYTSIMFGNTRIVGERGEVQRLVQRIISDTRLEDAQLVGGYPRWPMLGCGGAEQLLPLRGERK